MSSAPWVPATAGAPLSAAGWSALQTSFRDALAAHRHTGGADGPRLRGEDLDPSGTLKVASLDLSEGAVVGGRDLSDWMAEAERKADETLSPQIATKVPLTGGKISGDLGVGGGLSVAKDVRIGGKLVVGGKDVVPRVGIMSTWNVHDAKGTTVVLPRAAHLFGVWVGIITIETQELQAVLTSGAQRWTLRGSTFFDPMRPDTVEPVPAGTWIASLPNPGSRGYLVLTAMWV